MHHYPLWKSMTVLAVVLVSIVLALPNVFGETAALQLSRKDRAAFTEVSVQELGQLLERERIAYGFMVPTMLNAIVHDQSARNRDFTALKCLLVAAAPIQDATALAAREVFGASTPRVLMAYSWSPRRVPSTFVCTMIAPYPSRR